MKDDRVLTAFQEVMNHGRSTRSKMISRILPAARMGSTIAHSASVRSLG